MNNMTMTTIDNLKNVECRRELRAMSEALATGKASTWKYAKAVSNIVGGELFKEDFHDLKTFGQYVGVSKATLSQYCNAVKFVESNNLLKTRDVKRKDKATGEAIIVAVADITLTELTVGNAYLLSTLSSDELKGFKSYCEKAGLVIVKMTQSELKKAIKSYKDSLAVDETTADETTADETTADETTADETTADETTSGEPELTHDDAIEVIKKLMSKYNVTIDELK